ncbi:hypothetical protein [Aquisalimonas sp.]|uniref:hypothetical protein n=1 Tax=unclassified Aquisalimonas TaxID=2644645 RepID=UPI0025C0CF90|nr:hypothetical protein [Aquisalimonas sp.]
MNDLTLEADVRFAVCELVGSGAPDVLRDAGLPVPETEQTALPCGAGLVAFTGRNDYLVVTADPWTPPAATPPWCLTRSDRVLCLSGGGWAHAMRQLCPHDLRQLPEGGWLAAAVAGVTAWLYRHPDRPDGILLGCDPSYGAYLDAMLTAVVRDHDRLAED